MLTLGLSLVGLGLILGTTLFRIQPFICLFSAATLTGLGAGLSLSRVGSAIAGGAVDTLSIVAVPLFLGALLGRMLQVSSAADRISNNLIGWFGPARLPWALLLAGICLGIPMFFQVGLLILTPLVLRQQHSTENPPVDLCIPLAVGLSVAHGLFLPHPAVLATVSILKADPGRTICYGFLTALPSAALAGPIFIKLRRGKTPITAEIHDEAPGASGAATTEAPGFLASFAVVILPVALSFAGLFFAPQSKIQAVCAPATALALTTIISFVVLILRPQVPVGQLLQDWQDSFSAVVRIGLTIAAGGAFSKVFIEAGLTTWVTNVFARGEYNPILVVWALSAIMRFATGSPTVSMMAVAKIVAPHTAALGVRPELLVIALGSGALSFSHLNCAGFWTVKECFGLTVRKTLGTWSVSQMILGCSGLGVLLLLSQYLKL